MPSITRRTRGHPRNKTERNKPNNKLYIHPSIQIRSIPGIGKGVFASRPIKKDDILVQETPYHLPDEPYDGEYSFKLAKYLLSISPQKFKQLVPLRLHTDSTCKVETTPEFIENAKRHFPGVPLDTVKLYVLKIRRNAFKFGEVSGILFFATRMNHSCEPNVYYKQVNGQMVFRAKRDIEKGEEIYDTYIYVGDPYKERQSDLLKRYGFECKCTVCVRKI